MDNCFPCAAWTWHRQFPVCHLKLGVFFYLSRLRNDLYCVGWGVKLYSFIYLFLLI